MADIKEIRKFLKESNLIEDVKDKDSIEQAVRAWNFLETVTQITIEDICTLHGILMLNQDLGFHEIGFIRKIPVYIGGDEAMAPGQVKLSLETLAMRMWQHPENWRRHHIQFEKIHPFVDGNGRTGRMLMNWERLRVGLPVLTIKAGGEEQQEYYTWFQ